MKLFLKPIDSCWNRFRAFMSPMEPCSNLVGFRWNLVWNRSVANETEFQADANESFWNRFGTFCSPMGPFSESFGVSRNNLRNHSVVKKKSFLKRLPTKPFVKRFWIISVANETVSETVRFLLKRSLILFRCRWNWFWSGCQRNHSWNEIVFRTVRFVVKRSLKPFGCQLNRFEAVANESVNQTVCQTFYY